MNPHQAMQALLPAGYVDQPLLQWNGFHA